MHDAINNLRHHLVQDAKGQMGKEIQRKWAGSGIGTRLRFLRSLRSLIARHAIQLAELCGAARRCSVAEAMCTEVLPLADAAKFLQKNARSILKPQKVGAFGRPLWLGRTSATIYREPYGVVLVIGPGNYPLFLAGVQILQAIVAGNAVIIKPGIGANQVLLHFCDLLVEAGIDPGLISLLSESVESARKAISIGPNKVVFTGSAATGRSILAQLAPQLIPATMELSGSDAVIICGDADLRSAAEAVAFGVTLNGGATCIAPRRVFIPKSHLTEFENLLCDQLAPREWQLRADAANRVRGAVNSALREGARLVHGRLRNDGSVFGPLVLSSVQPEASILHEDIFDPLLSIVPVVNDREAILLANNSPFGLGVTIFSSNQQRATEVASQLQAGTVCINDLIVPTADPRLSFGGIKNSGFGVTRGKEGLLEMTVPKVVTVTKGNFRPAYKPARKGDENLFAEYLKFAHGTGIGDRVGALGRLGMKLLGRNK